jgi:hypothetical protein
MGMALFTAAVTSCKRDWTPNHEIRRQRRFAEWTLDLTAV